MQSIKKYLLVALKGLGMGAADVIPGVSGGTIAFMTGIYQELVDSIKSINLDSLKLLFKLKLKEFWKAINGNFLFSLVAGIFISVFSLAKLMQYLLVAHPIPLWSFFFGLILVSIIFILKDMKCFTYKHFISLMVGIAIGAFICLTAPAETPDNLLFLFLCGAIAICAMILPGISGSFVMLLLGKYAFIMDAVANFKIVILLVFASGAVIGLLSFSHLLSWLLKKFYEATLYLLCGLMVGSMLKIWPWKLSLSSGIDHPIWPGQYAGNPQLASAFIWMLVGVALVVAINLMAAKGKEKASN
ncbi:MAG: DUF368 domain-containing protein [Bacteroidales bacterium]|nr:DUF368 domain-containing protein [Bacteroidales bacterium]